MNIPINFLNQINTYLKSPLNYTGGKYKLLKQIVPMFPSNVEIFVDLSQEQDTSIMKPFNNKKVKSAKTYAEKKGFENERQASYLIDFEYKNNPSIVVFHDVKFKYNGRTAQVDHIIISPAFIFIVESKYFSGTVEIKNSSWEIKYKSKTQSIPSPILQNKRHIEVLEEIIANENIFTKGRYSPSCINIVLMSNKTKVKGKLPLEVVYADNLKEWIKKSKKKWVLKNPLKTVLSKQLMSDDELSLSAKRLLSFDISSNETEEKKKAVEKETVVRKKEIYKNNFTTQQDTQMLLSLKEKRKELAKQFNVKMLHHIFDNKTLEKFVEKKPKSKEDLFLIDGVGKIKLERYGEQFLEIINK